MTVAAVYLLAKRITDSWTYLHMVFVTSLSPVLVWYSQEIRGYAFAVLFGALMSHYFMKWIARPMARTLLVYGGFLLAGLLSNLSVAFIAAAHLLYLLSAPGRRKMVGRWVVAVLVVLLLFSPWAQQIISKVQPQKVAAGETGPPLLGGGGFSALALPYTLYIYSVGYSLGPSVRALQEDSAGALAGNLHWAVIAAIVFVIPGAFGIIRMAGEKPDLLLILLLWVAVPLVAISVLAVRNLRVFTPRYALVSVPAYAMIIGQGLAAISRSRYWVLTFMFTAVVGLSLFNYFTVPDYGKDDSRGAAEVIKSNLQEGDVVVGIYRVEPLMHYLRNVIPVQIFEKGDLESDQAKAERCKEMTREAERVWLGLCRDKVIDPEGFVHAWFESNMERVDFRTLPGIRVYLYEKQGA
jgi:uncharacterized membrane protein